MDPRHPSQTLHDIWCLLVKGAAMPRSSLHRFTLATLSSDGPQARTVILREAHSVPRTVVFHYDGRSPKHAELLADPRVTALFYGETERLQLRLRGRVELHLGDGIARGSWEKLGGFSRRTYLSASIPGTTLTAPDPGFPPVYQERAPTLEEAEPAFNHFVHAAILVETIDAYQLGAGDAWRMRFTAAADGAWDHQWVAP